MARGRGMKKKPDYRRAQTMIRNSLKMVAMECGITDPIDFGVVVSACHSAVVAELAPSDLLMKPGGVEYAAEVFTDQLRNFLMTDLTARATHERRMARH